MGKMGNTSQKIELIKKTVSKLTNILNQIFETDFFKLIQYFWLIFYIFPYGVLKF